MGTKSDARASLLKPLVLKTAFFQVLLRSQKARSQMRFRCSMVAPDSAARHHEMLKAVVKRKAKERVITGAKMASSTDGRVFHEVVGFPSERCTTSAAPIDEAMTQKIATNMGQCECSRLRRLEGEWSFDSTGTPDTTTLGFDGFMVEVGDTSREGLSEITDGNDTSWLARDG